MNLPVALREAMAAIAPRLQNLESYLESRLRIDLQPLNPVAIETRCKGIESVLQKLQTGRFGTLLELHDLVGAKAVMLRKSHIPVAIERIEAGTLVLVESNLAESLDPRLFAYHQPHLIVRLPDDYVERNPEFKGLRAEVQVTTALQHALDMSTHDFDYKGKSFSWGNFRIVAQLRGSLDLIDDILDDIEASKSARRISAACAARPGGFTTRSGCPRRSLRSRRPPRGPASVGSYSSGS
ncbi:MAG: RelA/SpoT domain-containing protein [Actinomycetota bacterium]|nr:RelA/SpoT domain-containing protein [Actinomycetota bacterium]MDQ3954109.1 RelA/SpoT domain-containing protein [Actinomycetota bacterium]